MPKAEKIGTTFARKAFLQMCGEMLTSDAVWSRELANTSKWSNMPDGVPPAQVEIFTLGC
ncbi:hypothetical protein GCM10022290_36000 [Sagittula marina]